MKDRTYVALHVQDMWQDLVFRNQFSSDSPGRTQVFLVTFPSVSFRHLQEFNVEGWHLLPAIDIAKAEMNNCCYRWDRTMSRKGKPFTKLYGPRLVWDKSNFSTLTILSMGDSPIHWLFLWLCHIFRMTVSCWLTSTIHLKRKICTNSQDRTKFHLKNFDHSWILVLNVYECSEHEVNHLWRTVKWCQIHVQSDKNVPFSYQGRVSWSGSKVPMRGWSAARHWPSVPFQDSMDPAQWHKLWLACVHFIEPTRTTNQQMTQAATIWKKIVDEEELTISDWTWIIATGMTIFSLISEYSAKIQVTQESKASHSARLSNKKKRPKK